MPLDGAMVATPPAGTTAVPNTVVASAPYNALKDDIYNIFNTKVQPLAGGGSGSSTAIGAFDAFTTKGADIATAATVNLDTATGSFDDLTGTTTVTAVTLAAGKHRMTRAAGDFQITVGALLIGNAGGANINVKTGDLIIWEGYAGGVVRFWTIPVSGISPAAPFPRGFISPGGLTLSNNTTDIVNDVDIGPGSARDNLDTSNLTLASTLTKRLDAAWAVGTGNGGLDTGAIADATYALYLIRRPDTGVVDAIFSQSLSAPTLPSNYTQYRYIGSVIRSSGAIVTFSQMGNQFLLKVPFIVPDFTNPGTAAVLVTHQVPANIKVDVIYSALFLDNTANSSTGCYLSSPDQDDLPVSAAVMAQLNIAGTAANTAIISTGQFVTRSDTSRRTRFRLSATAADYFVRFSTLGWVDTRGTI